MHTRVCIEYYCEMCWLIDTELRIIWGTIFEIAYVYLGGRY
jgi:hypothetical protein